MSWAAVVYLSLCLLSAAISIAIGAFCWRRRSEPGVATYSLVAWSAGLWTLGLLAETLVHTLPAKIFWDNVQFLPVATYVAGAVAFSVGYTRPGEPRTRWFGALAALPNLAVTALAFTDPWHHLIRTNVRLAASGPFAGLLYDFTPTFVLYGLYNYTAILFCGALLAAHVFRCHALYRAQAALVFVGLLSPTLGSIATLTVLSHSPFRDISPFAFAVGNGFVAWGLLRYRLFNVVPLARDSIVENLQDAVVVLDAAGRILDLNPVARAWTGSRTPQVLGRALEEVYPPWGSIRERLRGHADGGQKLIVDRLPHGPAHAEVRSDPLRDRRGRALGSVIVMRDVSALVQAEQELRRQHDHLEELVSLRTAQLLRANEELKAEADARERLGEQVQQLQKMEAMGRLAGGGAHDFNNTLVPIMGYAEPGIGQLPTGHPVAKHLTRISDAAAHAAGLTRQILAFSRRQVLETQVLDLNAVVRDFGAMLQRLVGAGISVEMKMGSSAHGVLADQVQIQQVLMNLVINARDAMPNGGRLTIETADVVLEGEDLPGSLEPPRQGPHVMIAVEDTGEGMSEAMQRHIFEPFFTTKEHGKGTGLGLATVFGIVKQHQGSIAVTSEPGRGSVFRIYLPACEATAARAQSSAAKAAAKNTGVILVVEDEEGVRRLVCDALRGNGYQVIEAADAASSASALDEHAGQIDLLLTDMIMPGGSGRDVYEAFSARHAEARVLFMSGYGGDFVSGQIATIGKASVLHKPFTVSTMLAKVREALA